MLLSFNKYIAIVLFKIRAYFICGEIFGLLYETKQLLIMKYMWHYMKIFYYDVLYEGPLPSFFITSISFTHI